MSGDPYPPDPVYRLVVDEEPKAGYSYRRAVLYKDSRELADKFVSTAWGARMWAKEEIKKDQSPKKGMKRTFVFEGNWREVTE